MEPIVILTGDGHVSGVPEPTPLPDNHHPTGLLEGSRTRSWKDLMHVSVHLYRNATHSALPVACL